MSFLLIGLEDEFCFWEVRTDDINIILNFHRTFTWNWEHSFVLQRSKLVMKYLFLMLQSSEIPCSDSQHCLLGNSDHFRLLIFPSNHLLNSNPLFIRPISVTSRIIGTPSRIFIDTPPGLIFWTASREFCHWCFLFGQSLYGCFHSNLHQHTPPS